ncbi:hypothetical protein ACLOJK_039979 [Asimina triloba]
MEDSLAHLRLRRRKSHLKSATVQSFLRILSFCGGDSIASCLALPDVVRPDTVPNSDTVSVDPSSNQSQKNESIDFGRLEVFNPPDAQESNGNGNCKSVEEESSISRNRDSNKGAVDLDKIGSNRLLIEEEGNRTSTDIQNGIFRERESAQIVQVEGGDEFALRNDAESKKRSEEEARLAGQSVHHCAVEQGLNSGTVLESDHVQKQLRAEEIRHEVQEAVKNESKSVNSIQFAAQNEAFPFEQLSADELGHHHMPPGVQGLETAGSSDSIASSINSIGHQDMEEGEISDDFGCLDQLQDSVPEDRCRDFDNRVVEEVQVSDGFVTQCGLAQTTMGQSAVDRKNMDFGSNLTSGFKFRGNCTAAKIDAREVTGKGDEANTSGNNKTNEARQSFSVSHVQALGKMVEGNKNDIVRSKEGIPAGLGSIREVTEYLGTESAEKERSYLIQNLSVVGKDRPATGVAEALELSLYAVSAHVITAVGHGYVNNKKECENICTCTSIGSIQYSKGKGMQKSSAFTLERVTSITKNKACKKKKRAPLSEERKAKKKASKRRKRAQLNREQGVKRLKLTPFTKPKVVHDCKNSHAFNGVCSGFKDAIFNLRLGLEIGLSHAELWIQGIFALCYFLGPPVVTFEMTISSLFGLERTNGEKCKFSHTGVPLTKSQIPLSEGFLLASKFKSAEAMLPPDKTKTPGTVKTNDLNSLSVNHLFKGPIQAQPVTSQNYLQNSQLDTKAETQPKLPAKAPEGIRFLSIGKAPLDGASKQLQNKSSPSKENNKKTTDSHKQTAEEKPCNKNEMPSRAHESAFSSKPPAGVRFFSLGKASLEDTSGQLQIKNSPSDIKNNNETMNRHVQTTAGKLCNSNEITCRPQASPISSCPSSKSSVDVCQGLQSSSPKAPFSMRTLAQKGGSDLTSHFFQPSSSTSGTKNVSGRSSSFSGRSDPTQPPSSSQGGLNDASRILEEFLFSGLNQ